jgi:hypothetical protein
MALLITASQIYARRQSITPTPVHINPASAISQDFVTAGFKLFNVIHSFYFSNGISKYYAIFVPLRTTNPENLERCQVVIFPWEWTLSKSRDFNSPSRISNFSSDWCGILLTCHSSLRNSMEDRRIGDSSNQQLFCMPDRAKAGMFVSPTDLQ